MFLVDHAIPLDVHPSDIWMCVCVGVGHVLGHEPISDAVSPVMKLLFGL